MKFPLSWLREIIPTHLEKDKIAEMLTTIGIEVEALYPTTTNDWIFEVALTPNLSFANNIVGIARELHALTGEPLHLPKIALKEEGSAKIEDYIAVAVEDTQGCPRYATRLVVDVEIAPSPSWIRERLEACGIRSSFNVVDITNYVMLELGQPLHAFDYDAIQEHKIEVRRAKKGEAIQTLDDKEYFLTEEALVIADGRGPIALAGIMGGKKSEVRESTKKVVLEAAFFDSALIRKTSRRLGIHSEASRRFERHVDPQGIMVALHRAAELMEKYCKGKNISGVQEICSASFSPKEISCRLDRINKILGTNLALSEVEGIFRRLGLKIKKTEDHTSTLQVIIPSYRHDLNYEIDLVEEVARLYGYDNIHNASRSLFYQGATIPHHPLYLFEKQIKFHLFAEGLQEFLTCDLISPEEAALVAPSVLPSRSLVKILNPNSLDHSILRPSLLPNMLQIVQENVHQDIDRIAGFELGRIHFKVKESYKEPTALAIILMGNKEGAHWDKKGGSTYDFFDLKGIVENFLVGMGVDAVQFIASTYENFHPGRQAKMVIEGQEAGIEIGVVAEVHPYLLKQRGLDQPLFFCEINVDDLFSFSKKEVKMASLPQFPSSTRDWTITIQENFPIGKVKDLLEKEGPEILEEAMVLDLYRSEQLGSEWKNVTFRFVYRDPHQTISFERVEREHEKMTQNVSEQLGNIIKG